MHHSSAVIRTRTGLRALALGAVALVTILAISPAARAADIPFGGGATQLVLNGSFEKTLRQSGVTVKPLGPAKLKGRKLTLPVQSGGFDPGLGGSSFAQAGGLKLVTGGKSVALRRLRLDFATKTLSATVAGKRIAVAHLFGATLKRDGFDARLKVKRLPLKGAAAATLSRALGLPGLLRLGGSLGSIDALGEASEVEISFGSIAIGGPGTAFAKLESMKVQMGIWGGTESWRAPGENYFVFPVTPTRIPPDASSGILEGGENDGITMQIHESPPREMLLRHPRIDLASRELTAKLSPLSQENPLTATIATLDYSAAKLQIRPKVGAFELMGIQAISNQFMADQLNERFATPGLFQAGEVLARVTITLHGRVA